MQKAVRHCALIIFCSGAERVCALAPQPRDISQAKLEGLMELSLRTSIAVTDPFKDDLSCFLHPRTVIQQLDAMHTCVAVRHSHSPLMPSRAQSQRARRRAAGYHEQSRPRIRGIHACVQGGAPRRLPLA